MLAGHREDAKQTARSSALPAVFAKQWRSAAASHRLRCASHRIERPGIRGECFEADALEQAVMNALGGFRGNWGSVVVSRAHSLLVPETGTDKPVDNSGQWRYWSRMVFGVVHSET